MSSRRCGRTACLTNLRLPVTEHLSRRGLILPSGTGRPGQQIDKSRKPSKTVLTPQLAIDDETTMHFVGCY